MRDIFGIAVAVVIALLSQIVEPWSGSWWATLTISAVIAIVVAGDIIAMSSGTSMLPIIGMGVCAIGFIGFAAWHFWPLREQKENQSKAEATSARPLRRLIAYGRLDLI